MSSLVQINSYFIYSCEFKISKLLLSRNKYFVNERMSGFSDLNLNISSIAPKAVDQLVEHAIKCKIHWVFDFGTLFKKLILVGYDNLGLSIDFEFPLIEKSKAKGKIVIPACSSYQLPAKLAARLKSAGRKIKIFNRINVKIKPADINTCLQHLVNNLQVLIKNPEIDLKSFEKFQKSKSIQDYDLISLEPTNNQVLMVVEIEAKSTNFLCLFNWFLFSICAPTTSTRT